MSASEARRVHGYVTGRVQGVYFRASTRHTADALGLTGWVRNLPDGRVEFAAEGAADAVERLVAWVRAGGPAGARVDDLESTDEAPHGERSSFEVRY